MHLGRLFSRYASWAAGMGRFDMYFLRIQVLTGEIPLLGVPDTAVGHYVLRGKRPDKPANAASIGFSDSLWDFTQHCWDGRIESRPEVGEVVKRLGEAATNWNGLMPPCVRSKDVTPCSEEETSDLGEFDISILY